MNIDAETRVSSQTSVPLTLWLRLHACHNMVLNHIRPQMQEKFNTTLPRFDLMAQLAHVKSGLRMGELSERLMVSNGNITSVVKQLEKEGFIERISNGEDRRSTLIKLSKEGQKAYTKMAKHYDACLSRLFTFQSAANTKKLKKSLADLKHAMKSMLETEIDSQP